MFEPSPGKQSIPPKPTEEVIITKTQTAPLYGAKAIGSPMMLMILFIILYFFVMMFRNPGFRAGFALGVIAYIVLLGLNIISIQKNEVVLTDRRLIFKSGKPNGVPKDYLYPTILNVLPVTPLLGRVFKYGHLDLVIEGQVNVERITGIQDHQAFADTAMKSLIDEAKKQTRHHPMYKE